MNKPTIITTLLGLVCALAGVAWAGHERRLSELEEKGSPTFQAHQARSEEQVEALRRDVARIEAKIDWLIRRQRGVETTDEADREVRREDSGRRREPVARGRDAGGAGEVDR
jgi:hypothetical protein